MRAFVVVEVRRVGRRGKEPPRQLQHVVGVAALAGLLRDVARERSRFLEILAVAVAADHVGAALRHRVPEEAGAAELRRVAGELGVPREADELRDLRVRVQECELVAARDERVEHRMVVEALREAQPARFAGARRELGKHLAHAAEFRAEHGLHLRVVEPCERALDEGGQRLGDCRSTRRSRSARRRRAGRRTACASCRTAPSSRSGRSVRSGCRRARSPP